MSFTINLTSLAVILWSGMLVIAGSIWVLSSQVRKLADLIEEQARKSGATEVVRALPSRSYTSVNPPLDVLRFEPPLYAHREPRRGAVGARG